MVLGFSFRESDAQRKARLMKRDRQADEERLKAFKNEEETRGNSKFKSIRKRVGSAYSKYEQAESSVSGRISSAKASVEGFKEQRALGKFKREEEHDARIKDARTKAEVKIYGRELTEEEREKFAKAKEERKSRPSRIQRFTEGVDKFNGAVGKLQLNDSVLSQSVQVPAVPDYSSLMGKPVSFSSPTKRSKKTQPQRDPLIHLDPEDSLMKFYGLAKSQRRGKKKDPLSGLL